MRLMNLRSVIMMVLFGALASSFWACGSGSSNHAPGFEETTDTLNTPELVRDYEDRYFSYATTSAGYGCGGPDIAWGTHVCDADYIYHTRKGNCAAYTVFGVYCLQKAGYEVYPMKIYKRWRDNFVPGAWPRDYHYMVLFQDNGWYTLDNSGRGIKGPYQTFNDLPFPILDIEGYQEFEDTVATLTTPQLINDYAQSNFEFGTNSDGYGCGNMDTTNVTKICPPARIFIAGGGNSAAFTTFSVHSLNQAGYQAYAARFFNKWPDDFLPDTSPRDYSYMAIYRDADSWYTLYNGISFEGISGPYNTIEDIPQQILSIEGM